MAVFLLEFKRGTVLEDSPIYVERLTWTDNVGSGIKAEGEFHPKSRLFVPVGTHDPEVIKGIKLVANPPWWNNRRLLFKEIEWRV